MPPPFRDNHVAICRLMEFNKRKIEDNFRLSFADKQAIAVRRGWTPINFQYKAPEWQEPMSNAESQDLIRRYGVTTTEALTNDTLDARDKVLAFVLKSGGRQTSADVLNEIKAAPYVTNIAEDYFLKQVKQLMDDGLIKEIETVDEDGAVKIILRAIGMATPEVRRVTDCTRLVDGSKVFWHRCIKVTKWNVDELTGIGRMYEIYGKYTAESIFTHSPLVLNPGTQFDPLAGCGKEEGVESSTGSIPSKVVGQTTKSDLEILLWNMEWFAARPYYKLVDNNCRHHAQALAMFLTGVDIGNAASMEFGNAMAFHQ